MDGYVVTATADEALATWGAPGVRHVAELDSGEGFVAFDGEVPCAGLVLENLGRFGPFWPHSIKRAAPLTDHDPETFGLYGSAGFRALSPIVVREASLVDDGMILALTDGRQPGATWQADVTRYLDVRVPQLAMA